MRYIFSGDLILHDIFFYKDRNGFEPVFAYLQELRNRNDKDSRIKLGKINDYIEMLSREGTFVALYQTY